MSDTPDTPDTPDAPPVKRSTSALTRKVGPLTVQTWAIVIVAGGILGFALRKLGPSSSGPKADLLLPVDNVDSGSGAPRGGWSAAGPNAGAAPGSGVGTPSNDPRQGNPYTSTSNLEWQRITTEKLVAAGYGLDPSSVSDALTRYLQGDALTPEQRAIVNMAIRTGGTPPEYVPAIVLAPAPAPATPGPPTGTPTPTMAVPTPPGQTNMSPEFKAWIGAYDQAKNDFLQGKNATELFPRMAALGISADDKNLQGNGPGVAWYKVWLNKTGRQDLLNSDPASVAKRAAR